jgi:hypothetical protein
MNVWSMRSVYGPGRIEPLAVNGWNGLFVSGFDYVIMTALISYLTYGPTSCLLTDGHQIKTYTFSFTSTTILSDYN